MMRKIGNWSRVLMVFLGLASSGCLSASSPVVPAANSIADGGAMMVRTELYLGLSRAGTSDITQEQFSTFLAEVVTPRFPDGLTVLDAVGQWRNASGLIEHEHSKLIIMLHEPGEKSARSIEEIRSEYKRRFGQESVMRVTSSARVAF